MEIKELFSSFGDYYEVSNLGYVVSKEGVFTTSTGRKITKKRARMSTFIAKKGHVRVNLYDNGRQMKFSIHRLVALAFIPNPDNKEFVNHKDGNKLNNHVSNLEWATRQENEDHAFATGLKSSTGSKNNAAKLDEDKVRQIRDLKKSGVSSRALAAKFNIDISNIDRIVKYDSWKHVK
jgi:hypothetical protein